MRFALPLLALVAFASSATVRADGPLAKALPDSTFVYLEIENVTQLRELVGQTQLGKLLADPALQPLKDDIKGKLEKTNDELNKQIGLTIGQLLELPQGAMTIAIGPRDDEKMPVSVLAAFDAGQNANKVRELAKTLRGKAEESGAKVGDEEFEGTTLLTIDNENNDEPPAVFAELDGTFILSAGAEPLKELIKNKAGRDQGSLAASEQFAAAKAKVGEADMLVYVDINALIKFGVEMANRRGDGNAQQAEAILQTLGLNNIKYAAGGLKFAAGPHDVAMKLFVASPQPASGILRLFQMPKVELRPEPWVPATVASYQTLSWDLDEFYEGLNELVDKFAPGTLGVIEQQLAGAGQPLSFQKDFFGPLGDRVSAITAYGEPPTIENQKQLWGVALEDAKAFQGTLNKVFAMAGVAPQERDFNGTKVLDFDLPQMPGGPGNLSKISLAIAKDHLFVATDPSLLESVLRGGDATLAESDDFRKVVQFVPGPVSSLSYSEPEQSARAGYELIKSGRLQEMLDQANPNGGDGPKLDEIIDLDKIPPYEVFKKYISSSIGYWSMDDDGILIQSVTTKPDSP